jgi:hypothetical protein
MRIRAAGIVALLVVVGVITSTVVTCVAGAMTSKDKPMASCGGSHDDCVSSGDPANCCKYSDPQLIPAKVDLLNAPIRHVLQWLTPVHAEVIAPAAISIASTGSPPELTTALGPPTYIVLSTLLI